MFCIPKYKVAVIFLLTIMLCIKAKDAAAQYSKNDTIQCSVVVYHGDTIEAKVLDEVDFFIKLNPKAQRAYTAWTQLRTAVYVTYPYAKSAGRIINDINAHLAKITSESQRKAYIKSREAEVKKEFEEPITNLTVYQGKILMKLINRETGNNCYDLIKEYRGGITARVYQTVAFFFDSNLKQPYDANGDDAEMEKIVLQVARMYGYKS